MQRRIDNNAERLSQQKRRVFQLKKEITIRDFDDKCIILIQAGCFFVSKVVGATTLEISIACITFQRFMIGIELNSFLVGTEC